MGFVEEYMIMPVIKGKIPGLEVDYIPEVFQSFDEAVKWLADSDEPDGVYRIDHYKDTEENKEACERVVLGYFTEEGPDEDAIEEAVFKGPVGEVQVIKRGKKIFKLYEGGE